MTIAVSAAHIVATDPRLTTPVRHIAALLAQGATLCAGATTVGPCTRRDVGGSPGYLVSCGIARRAYRHDDPVPCHAAARAFVAAVGVAGARQAIVAYLDLRPSPTQKGAWT